MIEFYIWTVKRGWKTRWNSRCSCVHCFVMLANCGHTGIIIYIRTLTTLYSFLTNAKLIILTRIQPVLRQFLLQINRIISFIHFLNPKPLSIKHRYAMSATCCTLTSEIISHWQDRWKHSRIYTILFLCSIYDIQADVAGGLSYWSACRSACFGFQNSTWCPFACRSYGPFLVKFCLALSHKLSPHIADSIFCNYMLRPFVGISSWRRCFRSGRAWFFSCLSFCIKKTLFLKTRLKDPTVVNHVIIFLIFSKMRFADFDLTGFYSLFIIISIDIICSWTYIDWITCYLFFIGAKWLIKPFLIIQTASNGCVLMTF